MKNLSLQAKAYILGMITLGAGLSAWQLARLDPQNLRAWLILGAVAAVAHILKVEGATPKSSYQISLMVYGFTYLLLGTPATIFVILVAHLVEWAWHRYPWYIQLFNIACFVLSTSAAGVITALIQPLAVDLLWLSVLGVLLAMAGYTFLNHLVVGLVVKLARGENFSQSGVFGRLTLMIDFSLLCMGAAAGVIWTVNPFAALLTLVPLYLIYSTLKVPALQRQTEIDPKTGLFNARFFARALENELARADRFDRPLTIVMADLDLLRNINNTYGHLAGDQVLIGIAEILRKSYRDYDVVSRFGGEEFAILMPETTPDQAYGRVEETRRAVEAAEFEIPTSVTPIKATMSFGISGREEFNQSPGDLIHNADLALYHAKLEGRNQTSIYSGEEFAGLFPENIPGAPVRDDASFQVRLDLGEKPFVPPPLRDGSKTRGGAGPKAATRPAPPARPAAALQPRPAWQVKAYIGLVAAAATAALAISFPTQVEVDWLGAALFTLVVLLTEGLSLEIYARNTTVSTATAPMVAGMLLFGPAGVLVLSVAQATTAVLKHRSRLDRLVFNASNQTLSGLLGTAPLLLVGGSSADLPIPLNVSLVLLATGVMYLSSTFLVTVAIHLDSGHPALELWLERFRWLAPYYMALGVVAVALLYGYLIASMLGVLVILIPLLMLRFSQVQYLEHTKDAVRQLRAQSDQLQRHAAEIAVLNEELLQALSQVIDLRDPYVLGHSQQVACIATGIARQLGLPPERVELVRKAALLHDIGKLGVREAILFKPDRLTAQEFERVKQHSTLGADIVDTCHSLNMLVPVIRHHHERFDGRGYPDGLRGQQIPVEARILALADALEAMTSNRPYRSALDLEQILAEIQDKAGSQFDPRVIKAFLDLVDEQGIAILAHTSLAAPRSAPTPKPARRARDSRASFQHLEPT